MRLIKVVYLVIGVLLFMGGATGSAIAQQSTTNIEPQLLDKLAKGETANFFVKMSAKADLSAANDIRDWGARGNYVYATLQQVAQQSQKSVISYAQAHKLFYKAFLTTNAVFIRDGGLQTALDLANIPGVELIRQERIIVLSDPILGVIPGPQLSPQATTDWGISDTKADQVWSTYGFRGAGIKVANIDTGVQWDHPALVNQYACLDDPGNPTCWSDPGNICGGMPCDNVGHGTHTMGTMVAKDDPALPYIAGMAPDATWIACKGCESNFCSDFALSACADWILAPGGDPNSRPDIVNNSWGGLSSDTWYLANVEAWRAAGIFPAFSAGNSYLCSTLGSPGDYQESFATTSHKSDRTISFFASKGPSAFGDDPYTKPNLSAPGQNICSTVPTDQWNCTYSGTSMASPHSAGAVALIWSACPNYRNQVDMTFQLLQNTADPPTLAGRCGAPADGEGNYTYGYGYLDALGAIQQCSQLGPTMHVASISLQGRTIFRMKRVTGTVVIQDQAGSVVATASVTSDMTNPRGLVSTSTSTTNTSGKAFFTAQAIFGGTWQLCVTDVTKDGYLYDPSQNVETCDTLVYP